LFGHAGAGPWAIDCVFDLADNGIRRQIQLQPSDPTLGVRRNCCDSGAHQMRAIQLRLALWKPRERGVRALLWSPNAGSPGA